MREVRCRVGGESDDADSLAVKRKSDVGASAVARLPKVARKHLGRAAEGRAAFPEAASKEGPQFAEKAGADVGGVYVHRSSQTLVDLYASVFEERMLKSDGASDVK